MTINMVKMVCRLLVDYRYGVEMMSNTSAIALIDKHCSLAT